MAGGLVRTAEQIRLDIGATASEIEEHEKRGADLRRQLGRALAEARDHPELTLEEGRQIPDEAIPRQTANRLIRGADSAAYDRSKADPHDQAHGLDR
jgi:hypothetical protein